MSELSWSCRPYRRCPLGHPKNRPALLWTCRRKPQAMGTSITHGRSGTVIARQSSELLELFYAVHYRGNMTLEDAMRGELTRKQAAILWLMRSEGDISAGMHRKETVGKVQ